MHSSQLDPREFPYMGEQQVKKRKAGDDFI